jgi:hypothetical protein
MTPLEITLQRLQSFIQGVNPAADVSPGSVLNELLLKVCAEVHTELISNDLYSISQASAVSQVFDSTVNTYSPVIDKIASNYNVARNTGANATGFVKIFVTKNQRYYIPTGFKLIQPSLKFVYLTTQSWDVVLTTPTESNQAQLFPVSATNTTSYYFIVPVEAEAVGEENGNEIRAVQNNTAFTLDINYNFPEFIEAHAYGNFSKGVNVESDQELIHRFKEGLSIKSLVSPVAIKGKLIEQFPDIKAVSVVGANDYEMQRAKENIFGISTLGTADIYVRPSVSVASKEVVCRAVLNTTNVYYEVVLHQDATALGTLGYTATEIASILEVVPFYSISRITDTSSGENIGLSTMSITFSYDDVAPNSCAVYSATQARFSKYQVAAIRFSLANMNGAKADRLVSILFNYAPTIPTIQDYVLDDANRNICADFLVKAVVPCLVTVSLTLTGSLANPITAEIAQNIKLDIFNYINSIPFGEDLVASRIVDICHNYNQVKKVVLPVRLKGDIILPVASRSLTATDVRSIYGTDILAIPDTTVSKIAGVSKKTAMFFTNVGSSSVDSSTDAINITY